MMYINLDNDLFTGNQVFYVEKLKTSRSSNSGRVFYFSLKLCTCVHHNNFLLSFAFVIRTTSRMEFFVTRVYRFYPLNCSQKDLHLRCSRDSTLFTDGLLK